MKANQIGEFTNEYVHLQLKNNPENKAKAMQVSKRDYWARIWCLQNRTYSRRRTQAGLGRLVYQQEQISPNNVQTSNWGPIFFSVLSLSMKHHLRRSSGICKTKWSVANSSKVGTGLIWKRAGPNGSYGGDTARKQHCVTMKERYHCRNGGICDPSHLSIQAFWQEGFLLRHSQYKLSCIVKNPSSYPLKLYLMFASNFN